MKRFYQISTFVLATLLIVSFTYNELTDNQGQEENTGNSKQSSSTEISTNRVPLSKAMSEMDIYQIGLDMMPTTYLWNSETGVITYVPKTIDSDRIKGSIDSLIREYHGVTTSATLLTFSNQNSLARSYFVHMDDINALFDCRDSTGVNGVRIYMAARSNSAYTSHIYLAPAWHDSTTDTNYYLGDSSNAYVLDLTTPCPKACGGSMQSLIPSH